MSHEKIIDVSGVTKQFIIGDNRINALSGVNLDIRARDFAMIYGPSGCGKSTLLNVISGLEEPTQGTVKIRGENIYLLSDDFRAKYRSDKFGIITQMSHWVSSLNVWENVAIPLVLKGASFRGAKSRALEILDEVEMTRYVNYSPYKLSGGQQQRVSIARSLVRNPWIIIADEPTGNLDTHTADQIMMTFKTLNSKHRRTIIMVTHNLIYLPYATTKIAMKDGIIESQTASEIAEELEKEIATLKESE